MQQIFYQTKLKKILWTYNSLFVITANPSKQSQITKNDLTFTLHVFAILFKHQTNAFYQYTNSKYQKWYLFLLIKPLL